jgi:putative ABC transport system substrate-binding protein
MANVHLKRRDLITLLGGAVAWPLAARGQQAERMRRIGMLVGYAEIDPEGTASIMAFQRALQEAGWIEKRNIQIFYRWAAGDPTRISTYAAELVGFRPDVIFCHSTPVVATLQRETRAIPIVFVNANNPVGSGFITSLARPGSNITGFVSFEPEMGGKWLEILREIAPGVVRVALIYNPKTHTGQYFQSIEAASRSLAVKLIRVPFQNLAEIDQAIDNFALDANGSLLVLPDVSTTAHSDSIIRLAAQHRLPAIYPFRLFVASGGLAYYGTDEKDLYRKAAEYVDRILRGEKPADLPVQAPTKFELMINLKTAKAIGLDVPPMLLARADEVIE